MRKVKNKKRVLGVAIVCLILMGLVHYFASFLPASTLLTNILETEDVAEHAAGEGEDETDEDDADEEGSNRTAFLDLLKSHWSAVFVERLANLEVVQGYPDGTFKPGRNINRAELTKMALRAFEIEFPEAVEKTNFPDVPRREWFAIYVEKARELGIVEGYEDGTFKPGRSVSRIEALKIILESSGLDLGSFIPGFKDVSLGTWMDKYIGFAAEKGVVEGYEDGTFRAGVPINRAEASKIIIKVLDLAVEDDEDSSQLHGTVDLEEGITFEGGPGGGESGGAEGGDDDADELADEDDDEDVGGGDQGDDDLADDDQIDDLADDDDDDADDQTDDPADDLADDDDEEDQIDDPAEDDEDEDEDDEDADTTVETDPCLGITCPAYCLNDTRYYGGACTEGECDYDSAECVFGCSDGECKLDPCTGVTCPVQCDGNTREYDGECVDGQCAYETETCSYQCTEGACVSDPCVGVICPDSCDDDRKILSHNGQCIEGECWYEEQTCDYLCFEEACKVNPCDTMTCENMCVNDWLFYDRPCSEGWCLNIDYKFCDYGCEDGACVGDPCVDATCPDMCEGSTRKYSGDCTSGTCQYATETCAHGCTDGTCDSDPCAGVSCPQDYCDGDTRRFLGQCIDGQCSYGGVEQCYAGCEAGQCNEIDYCEGVECPSYCSGLMAKNNGICGSGVCRYDSEPCDYECTDGVCTGSDPCIGMSCPDFCAGTYRVYLGECEDGGCDYAGSHPCPFGCSDGVCRADPCDGVSCPDTCSGSTRKYGGECSGGVCQYQSEACSYDCEGGDCIADPCIGVSCPDYCADRQTFKWHGACVDGACQYEDISCGFKCYDDYYGFVTCMDEPPMGTIFVTRDTRLGNFGGVDKADEYCQDSAESAGISGSWIALVSDSRVQMKDRIPDSIYKRMDGEIIASSKEDLLDGSIAVPINMTEYGVEYTGYSRRVWTGTDEDGSVCESLTGGGCHCYDWTASGEFGSGSTLIGKLNETNADWIADAYQSCTQGDNHLYCMSTGYPIGTIFVTDEAWNGNLGGVEGADEKCQDATVDPEGFSGNWRALISAPGVDARDRIPDTLYKRVDGEVIAWDKEDLFDGSIENPINVTENGEILIGFYESGVWSATAWDGDFSGGSADHCNSWSDDSSPGGQSGNAHEIGTQWIDRGNGNCGYPGHLYCVKTDYIVW